jgi:hypothetical protein
MDQILDALAVRFQAQHAAGWIKEFHDDEPKAIGQYPAAFAAVQGAEIVQFTVGQPGKIITRWEVHVHYLVPLADGRGGFRRLAQIAPLVIADWLRHRRLGGIARDMQVGQQQNRGQFVDVAVAKVDHRSFVVPLFIETEEAISS